MVGSGAFFWPVEVGPEREEGSVEISQSKPSHTHTFAEAPVCHVRSSEGHAAEDKPPTHGALITEGIDCLPGKPLHGGGNCKIDPTCFGTISIEHSQISLSVDKGTYGTEAIGAKLNALEHLIQQELGDEPPFRPWRWHPTYYQGEIKLEGGAHPAPRQRCQAPLDTIGVGVVDLNRLKAWAYQTNDDALLKALGFMSDDIDLPSPFTIHQHGAIASDGKSQNVVSRSFSTADIDIINSISEICTDLSEPSLPLFKVPKKTGTARLIQDGRSVNSRTSPPPKMGLPDLDSILSRAGTHPHMAQADAKAFFFQLPLARRYRKFFSFNLCCKRGKFETRQLTRTPMGFNHAPFGAQSVANAVARYAVALTKMPKGAIVIDPWVDNFIVAATSKEGLEEGKRALEKAFKFFNLQATWVNSNQILGLSFAPSGVCLAREFVEKALYRLREQDEMQALEAMQMMGCVMWASITTIRTPLSETYPMLQLLQKAASLHPRDMIPVEGTLKKAMSTWRRLLRRNRRYIPTTFPAATELLWTDASMSTAAAVSVAQQHANYIYTQFATSLPIYYKELLAALLGVEACGQKRPARFLLTDNQALASALAKGHSTAGGPTTNATLAHVLRNICGVAWVPTDQQLADSLTRIPRVTPNPLRTPDIKYPLYQSFYLPGGRGQKGRRGGPVLTIHNKLQQPQNCLFVHG